MALGLLSASYMNRKDMPDAQTTMEQQMKVEEEVYGLASPQLSWVRMGLGRLWLEQGEPLKAETIFKQNLNEKAYGENSEGYSSGLKSLAYLYYTQKQFEKVEPLTEKAEKIDQTLYGAEGPQRLGGTTLLCRVYEGLQQPAKSEPCYSRLIAMMEKVYGANSPALTAALTSEAKALRGLGRVPEAEMVEKRLQGLSQPSAGLNQ